MMSALDHQETLGARSHWREDVNHSIALQAKNIYDERIAELHRVLAASTEKDLLPTLQRFLADNVSALNPESLP
jgi:hypothetical protein